MLACGSRASFLSPSAVLYLVPTMASHSSGLRRPLTTPERMAEDWGARKGEAGEGIGGRVRLKPPAREKNSPRNAVFDECCGPEGKRT